MGRHPSVTDLPRQLCHLWTRRADVDGDIVSWPLERQLESAVGLEELPIVLEWFPPNAHPDDIYVLTSPLDRLVRRKAVPALDQGEVSATQAQDQSATRDFIK